MYFNFDDRQPDIERIEGAISWREGRLAVPRRRTRSASWRSSCCPRCCPVSSRRWRPSPARSNSAWRAMREQESNDRRFVFVQPRAEFEAQRPPQNPELSDRDRTHHDPVRADAGADQPAAVSRGATRRSAWTSPARRKGRSPRTGRGDWQRSEGSRLAGPGAPDHRDARDRRPRDSRAPRPEAAGAVRRTTAPGRGAASATPCGTCSATCRADRSTTRRAGGQFGPAIQFDTKGVEFGPWVRRFIAQIRRNWFIPYAAMSHDAATWW